MVGEGLLTEQQEIVLLLRRNLGSTERPARDVMARPVLASPEMAAGEAVTAAERRECEVIFIVVSNRTVVGVVSVWDARAVDPSTPVRRIASPAATASTEAPLHELARIIRDRDACGVAVLHKGRAVGVVTRRELAAAGVSRTDLAPSEVPFEEMGVGD